MKSERKFSEEKTIFYSVCGKIQVAPQVRARGEYILKELYAGRDEVIEIINEVSQDYDVEQVKSELIELEDRISDETEEWNSNVEGVEAIKCVLKIGKTKKNDEIEGSENDSDEIKI
jgi:hypothetical protein